MSSTLDPQQAFHRGTEAIFAILTPDQTRQIAELHADPALVDRLAELAEKANDGALAPEERDEYLGYIEANNLVAALQAEARLRLAPKST